MSAGFAPGATALLAVKLGPAGSQLAFGHLKPIQPFAREKIRKKAHGLTQVIDFHPTQLVSAQLLSAC